MIISIFLVRYLHKKNVVTHLMTPISRLVVAIAALIYVDDTDLHVFNDGDSSTEEIVRKAQRLVDTWHAVLQVTGGDLKHCKCYWTLQDYRWSNGICYMKIDTDRTLLLPDNGTRKAIKHVPADVARVLVGVPICPSHEEQPVVDILNKKIAGYIEKLTVCKLNAQDVYFGYQHYW